MNIPPDDADQFFRLMWGLQFYVKEQRQLLPNITSCEAYIRLDGQEKSVVRDALWEHPELIDTYIQMNPDKRSEEELAIIGKWKKFVVGKFYVFRYLKDHAIFIGSGKSQVYGVKALYDSFEVMLGGRPLPVLVEAVLLPYKGQIIHDGLFYPYNIYFGGGIRRDLKEEYMAAKQNNRILTSLEAKTQPAQAVSQTPALSADCEKMVAEIAQTTSRLRGGAAVQNAAFSVLRASAKMAEAAVSQPENIEELQRLGCQIHNALNRMQKVLDRAGM